ncbi:fatty acyl-CoA reductase wat-like isoform X2 [Venturia canescens]|nr:fatty acyl-CoA reductase wat-like isoform X2 [Venturia canescens]
MEKQTGKTYLKDMMTWQEESVDEKTLMERSEIIRFYDHCNVLVTGGSGFMGTLLVEKLLRSCPNIKKLFLLMRAKKGKTSEERYKEHFEGPVFCRLKRERPNFLKKVVMVEGQIDKEGLGLTPENRELLLTSNIVFHGAATVRFDETIRFAMNVNVRGTREMLILARNMPNLKAFVHVGTAFSHCVTKVIDEIFYDVPLDADKLLNLIDILDDDQLKLLTPSIVGDWPNTYAFTKAIGEDVVRKYSTGIPTCIVRPSIMIATAKEPIPAWINNLYGPQGVVIGAGMGLLRTLHCESTNIADMIPADYVINNTIAAAWGIESTRNLNAEKSMDEKPDSKSTTDPVIYNSVSSCQNPVTWGEFMKWNEIFGVLIPSAMVLWYYSFTLNKHLWMHNVHIVLFHLVPAGILDTLAVLVGRKPMLWNAYKKIHKFSGVISYFSTQQWTFRNEMVMRLWDRLNPADRKLFYFNLVDLEWEEYFFFYVRGLRLFLMKDPLETIERGKARYWKLKIAHNSLVAIAWMFVLWVAYSFLRFIFFAPW